MARRAGSRRLEGYPVELAGPWTIDQRAYLGAGGETMKQWSALRSKPKRETSVVALLERAEIETYLPRVSVRKEGRESPALVPFFPSYLFARLDPFEGEIRMARYNYGVLHVVSFGGEPCAVPGDLIGLMRESLTLSQQRGHAGEFVPGDRVVVTAGPLDFQRGSQEAASRGR